MPGSQVDLLLLAVVAKGPIHGYAIIEQLHQKSDGTLDLPEGTVYPALYRLERLGLVRSRTLAADIAAVLGGLDDGRAGPPRHHAAHTPLSLASGLAPPVTAGAVPLPSLHRTSVPAVAVL